MSSRAEEFAKTLLKKADVEINGSRPWDMTVHNPKLYERVLRSGTLGLGEGYMEGWWDAGALDEFMDHVLRANLKKHIRPNASNALLAVEALLLNLQSKGRAFQVGEEHYDIGNDLYKAMLDPRLVYTCGYWSGEPPAKNLAEAQEAKLDLVCRKIGLKAGQRILDIGCGWGSFAKFAAEKYGAQVVGVTISKEQVALGTEFCKGLPVEIRLQDYRDLNERFDHIVSLGMFEHVGPKNYRIYFEVASRCLKDDGLFLLHTIGSNRSHFVGDAWISKYIFPNGILPSMGQITRASERFFVVEDLHNFGPDYDKTLMAWFANFEAAWPSLKDKYSPKFYRMWRYYLLMCAGSFRARYNHLWQFVLSKGGIHGGYLSVR